MAKPPARSMGSWCNPLGQHLTHMAVLTLTVPKRRHMLRAGVQQHLLKLADCLLLGLDRSLQVVDFSRPCLQLLLHLVQVVRAGLRTNLPPSPAFVPQVLCQSPSWDAAKGTVVGAGYREALANLPVDLIQVLVRTLVPLTIVAAARSHPTDEVAVLAEESTLDVFTASLPTEHFYKATGREVVSLVPERPRPVAARGRLRAPNLERVNFADYVLRAEDGERVRAEGTALATSQ